MLLYTVAVTDEFVLLESFRGFSRQGSLFVKGIQMGRWRREPQGRLVDGEDDCWNSRDSPSRRLRTAAFWLSGQQDTETDTAGGRRLSGF